VSNEVLLSVRDLAVSFFTHAGEVQAVRGVDLHLDKGETIAIVGESGCGKTVTVQSTMGLLQKPGRIKRGEVVFCGQNIIGQTPKQLRKIQGNEMAMIFQDPLTYLNPTMRVGNQIAEVYLEHHGGRRRDAMKKVIEMMELTSLPSPAQNIRRYPHQFSGGMRQRVMVAMALICGPRVLFADEPTTALDVTIQAQIIDLMNSLKDRLDTAIVLITHDLGVVAKMAGRIYVMYAGKVVEHGDADTIFEHPRHPYTWGLLKSVPSLDNLNKEPLFSIKGTPPDLLSPPAGCAFAPRCKHAMHVCARLQPEYTAFDEPGHYAACWLCSPEVTGGGQDAG
jgi:oligopeptide transport system ATP-binding protein